MKVPFYRHSLSRQHACLVADVLASPFLTTADRCAEVEQTLCAFFNVPFAKLTSSWTAGAVASLLALNIGAGDEVIVPAMTFVATANVVRLVGATPIFVDVDARTLLIDIAKVRAALTSKTKAVVPVHLYGQMVDIRKLREAVGPDIRIIEDAAHCFEGTRYGRRPGQDGDLAIFSFYATKNVTCGEGGAVVTRDAEFAAKLAQTVLHGMSVGAAKRFEGGQYRHWDVDRLGVKANMPDLLAALLKPQIETVEERLQEREALARRYEDRLSGTLFSYPLVDVGAVSARHLFPIFVPGGGRDCALTILAACGVGATVNYRAVPTLTLYSQDKVLNTGALDTSLDWGDGTLSLPLFPGLSQLEQDYVIDILLNDVQKALRAAELTDRRVA